MMRPKIWVESPHRTEIFIRKIRKAGFILDKKKPDFVLTYGGDGNILIAEAKYPGIPKIPVRKSEICSKCDFYDPEDLGTALRKLKQDEYLIRETEKVEAVFGKKRIVALNEVQVRNKDPRHAIRFSLQVDGKKINVIGDGIVASTGFGSTGYYKSLGYEPFLNGVRVALNNPVSTRKFFSVNKKAVIKILREKALLAGDNQEKVYELKEGSAVVIRKSRQNARFVRFL
jgi:NAD kinase